MGTTFGGNDLSVGGVTNHSKTVSNLPNSGTIYVRYYTQVGPNSSDPNDWSSEDHTYTMNVGGGTPLTLSPTTVTLSSGGQQTFTGAGGVPPFTFVVTADTTGGATVNATTGLYTAGPNPGTSTVQVTDSVSGTANATVTVQTSGSPLVITSPTPGSTLTSNTVTFIGGHTSSDFAHSLWVGTTFGGNDLSVGGVTNHSKTVSNLPNSGTIYVRYYTQVGPNSSDPNDWSSEDHTYTMNVGGSASLNPEAPTIHLAAMSNFQQNTPSHVHRLNWEQADFAPTTRLGGGLFGLRFGIPQLAIPPSNPLVHLTSHGGTPSTTISPAAGSVLAGSTVTFSWSYTGGSSSGTDVAYKYTGKERDDSTGLYFYEARYYDAILGRFISADTIVPNPNNPQTLNRYTYTLNNPMRYTDPTGNTYSGCDFCGDGYADYSRLDFDLPDLIAPTFIPTSTNYINLHNSATYNRPSYQSSDIGTVRFFDDTYSLEFGGANLPFVPSNSNQGFFLISATRTVPFSEFGGGFGGGDKISQSAIFDFNQQEVSIGKPRQFETVAKSFPSTLLGGPRTGIPTGNPLDSGFSSTSHARGGFANSAKNPLTLDLVTPAIDTIVSLEVSIQGNYLNIRGTARGDNFPSLRFTITDSIGQTENIAVYGTQGGTLDGPLSLFIYNDQFFDFNVQVPLNAQRNIDR